MKIHPLKKTMTLCALGCILASSLALADTSGKKIAFSNNYAGNSWRQAMLAATTPSPRRPSPTRW
jgi:ABC-type sugar transport system substrate-binding protein